MELSWLDVARWMRFGLDADSVGHHVGWHGVSTGRGLLGINKLLLYQRLTTCGSIDWKVWLSL